MNRLAFYLTTAVLPLALGMTAAAVWIVPPLQSVKAVEVSTFQINSPIKITQPSDSQAVEPDKEQPPMTQSSLKTIKIEDICQAKARLMYRGYEITNNFNPVTHISSVNIKRGEKILASHESEILDANMSLIGLFPILKGKTKQLIIMRYSGGAHCCYSLLVYDLYPDLRLIFNSDDYPLGDYRDECNFLDLNRDGEYEFKGDILTFADDFEGLINIESPRIPMVFKYDKRSEKYYPANHKFLSYALAGTDKEIKEIKKLNKSPSTRLEGFLEILDVVLRYIYAGKEKEAWKLYDKEFGGGEKLRSDIKDLLKKDSAYKFIYHPCLHTHYKFI